MRVMGITTKKKDFKDLVKIGRNAFELLEEKQEILIVDLSKELGCSNLDLFRGIKTLDPKIQKNIQLSLKWSERHKDLKSVIRNKIGE